MQSPTENPATFTSYRLPVSDLRKIYYFLPQQIIRLEASDNYTLIYFDGRPPFVVSKVLKCYEEVLKPFGFVRTHRSHIVNRSYIKCIHSDTIIMQDASVAELSRRKKHEVIKELGCRVA